MRGLPDERCQCPQWGYVISGSVTFRFPDRDEVYEAGEAFYTAPGHIPVRHEPETEIVMFSPADQLRETGPRSCGTRSRCSRPDALRTRSVRSPSRARDAVARAGGAAPPSRFADFSADGHAFLAS
jgi:hypothetical protein